MVMEKTILSLIALLAFSGSALAGNKPVISVADVEVMPGQTASFAVNLLDGKADTYTSMTLNAEFPTTGFTTTGDYTVYSAWKGVSCTVGTVNGEGKATIPFASSNPIPGSAVENLVTVSFKVDESVAVGTYEITLKETLFEYNTSDKDYADDVTFNVIVTNRLTLDEASTVAPAAAEGVNVKVKRNIKAGEWSTICLPFTMKASKVKSTFGSNVQVRTFAGFEAEIDAVTNKPTAITLKFATPNNVKLEEGVPYLIKSENDVESFELDDVDIIATAGSVKKDIDTDNEDYEDLEGKFKGTFTKTKVPNKSLFISGNKFYYSTGKTDIKGFRGWFELDAILNEAIPVNAPIYMSFDDETTGIKLVRAEDDDSYYDLNGRKVLNPKKGLYINNGKKVVVK